MTTPTQPARRRFVPVPIETTFEQFRRPNNTANTTGPTFEPTPSPSPRTPSPTPQLWTKPVLQVPVTQPKKEKRHFAPQLIESSRRSRRIGDVGPATKPTDKTDITPYHNHIYAPKSRKKHAQRKTTQSLARRESCDEETAAHVFEMLAREAEKRMLEDAALAAYPNSRARAGGAEHFVIREGSDDDSSGSGSQSRQFTGHHLARASRRTRRDSLTEDVGWAFKEMQEHLGHLTHEPAQTSSTTSPVVRPAASKHASAVGTPDITVADTRPIQPMQIDRISTLDLDRMSMESPPSDPIWTTTARQSTDGSQPGSLSLGPSFVSLNPIGETFMPYIAEEPQRPRPSSSHNFSGIPSYARQLREAEGEGDEDEDLLLRESAARVVEQTQAAAETPAVPPEPHFRGRNAYAGYRNRDLFAAERDVGKTRKKSPPMLGKDLTFIKCQSPKQTKMEPEYLWSINDVVEKSHHSHAGKKLDENAQQQKPQSILTGPSTTRKAQAPGQPSPGLWHGLCHTSDQTQAVVPIQRPTLLATPYPPSSPCDPFAEAFGTSGTSSMASSMDERLEKEQRKQEAAKAQAAAMDDKIATEFTDRFVTQVYNYLSLGYPAMARDFDEELSKISNVSVKDLQADDLVDNNAKGHISLDDDDAVANKDGLEKNYNHDNCPRWHALKVYIAEWARQHPDLNSIDPLAWGMRERRGSWGL